MKVTRTDRIGGALLFSSMGILALGLLGWGNWEGTDGWPAVPRIAYVVGRVVLWTAIAIIWIGLLLKRRERRRRGALPKAERHGNTRFRRMRDRLASGIANFALNHIASSWYRDMIAGSIKYGLGSAAVDASRHECIVFDHDQGIVRRERTDTGRFQP